MTTSTTMPRALIVSIWLCKPVDAAPLNLSVLNGSFRKLRVPYFGVLILRVLLFRVLY